MAQSCQGQLARPTTIFNGFGDGFSSVRRAQDKIDAVAVGRLFISNPDLVARLHHGAELTCPA
jgi:2,4-dienoyl-CoA reductase-like NADH-dependent reductase (Old Yellow Enzyme family)